MKHFAALGIALLVIAAASVGPWAPSPFTSQTGTNTTAAAWRVALGVTSGSSLTNAALVGGTVVNQTNTSLTASRLMVTDANKVPTNNSVTATEAGYLSGVTAALQTQIDAKPTVALTNLALLNATNTFLPAGLFPANNIGMRLLWSSPTNIFLESVVTNATSSLTNNGDFSQTTYVASGSLPPLLGSNSSVCIVWHALRTNANASAASLNFFIGSNTNFVGYNSATIATSAGVSANILAGVMVNANSMTNQLQGNLYNNPNILMLTNFANTAISNSFYLGAMTATSHTNAHLIGLKFFELYAP